MIQYRSNAKRNFNGINRDLPLTFLERKILMKASETNSVISTQQNRTESPAQTALSISELIERKHRLKEEIAEIDYYIERAALRSEGSEEDESSIFSIFRDSIRRLLVNFWDAPNKMLSHEEIKDYVLSDEERSDNAVYDIIREARAEIKKQKIPYEIENIWGKGYQLVKRKV